MDEWSIYTDRYYTSIRRYVCDLADTFLTQGWSALFAYSSRTALELAVFLNDDVEFAYLFERYIEQFLGGLIY